MICKRITPAPEVYSFVKEYLLLHAVFDKTATILPKLYPVIPEEGLTFIVTGSLYAESPELNIMTRRSTITLFGIPARRQNLFISHQYMMVHVRFQPGALFNLLGIPMVELVHQYIDAELVFGAEIKLVHEQLANASQYDDIPIILNAWFKKKLANLKISSQPVDKIGRLILENPQQFNLDKISSQACLSNRQFEKRFLRQIGITPKYFSRICRFYQAYELKEYHPELSWFSIAIRFGYADYQHLVKDFKQFAGISPTALIEESFNNPERILNIAKNFRGV